MVAIVNGRVVEERTVMPVVAQDWNICIGNKRNDVEEFQEMTLEEIRKYWRG
ncbi:MAG: hypothetical protein AMQ74_01756 [Candidatus Methanofastidiosum methylothiophilum]|uniref:Uncharacterized protein n=1 Tax=Candidatus Methanofastidiosum methylothiophilum TaxID=1705564 RepID=A0A150IQ51_9EURY|nr:MAG: hypothetical protein AMQ74_01756 [Candidatus Methanofastidiosum methylthiophilus]